jgi:hydroxyacylglutathione hydrolase
MSTATIPLPRPRSATLRARLSFGIEPPELNRRLHAGRVVVVDTRSADAFDAGHIPGALNLAGEDGWDAVPWLLPAGADVAIVGSTPHDTRRAASRLAALELDCHPAVVAGGIDRWRRHGLPVDRGLAIDAPRAGRQLQHGGVALIDTRPAEEFNRAHVVGSIGLPLKEWGSRSRGLPRVPLIVGAATGEAAAAAASLFRATGHGCVWRIDGGGIEQMLELGATLPVR